MNKTQIAVLGLSVVAFGAAYMLFNSGQAPAPSPVIVQAAPKLDTDEVLVAAQDVPMGTQVGGASVSWQVWPKTAISEQMIVRSTGPTSWKTSRGQ
jgi:pilus assembly protein CpaB